MLHVHYMDNLEKFQVTRQTLFGHTKEVCQSFEKHPLICCVHSTDNTEKKLCRPHQRSNLLAEQSKSE